MNDFFKPSGGVRLFINGGRCRLGKLFTLVIEVQALLKGRLCYFNLLVGSKVVVSKIFILEGNTVSTQILMAFAADTDRLQINLN